MQWLIQISGWALILLALCDIYFTVLYPRGHKGPLSAPFSRAVWQYFRLMASLIPRQRSQILSFCGPTLLVAIVTVWLSLLLCGFALVIWPDLGRGIQAASGPTSTDFATAVYVSGFTLTTLGVGDLIPKTSSWRMLMILEAVVGISSVTLILTYFQSVYSALIRRNTFALSLQHRSVGTADAAELLVRLGPTENFDGLRHDLADMAKDLQNLLESDHTYPVLHYFRFQEAYYALPRMLFLAMDIVTLIVSALDTQKYPSLVRSAAVAQLWGGGMQLLQELSASFLPKGLLQLKAQSEHVWRQRYYRAVERLSAEGIATVVDVEAGAEQYIYLRWQWGPMVVALADYLGHDWSEVAPADSRTTNLANARYQRLPLQL